MFRGLGCLICGLLWTACLSLLGLLLLLGCLIAAGVL